MTGTLSLSLGEFFAEASLKVGGNIKSSRWPLSKMPLIKGLQSFLEGVEPHSITQVQVNMPMLESLLRRRLGTPPAFLTTAGFENWLEMNLPVEPRHFSLQPRRVRPPLDSDLVFGISERIQADGNVLKAFDPGEIDFLVSKLQMNEIKWVALGLLHADKNSLHEDQIEVLLKEKGFEVIKSSHFESDAERPRWWAAVLSAYLAPLVEEWTKEVKNNLEALEIKASVRFWSCEGLVESWKSEDCLKLLFGSPYILKSWAQSRSIDACLFLDLEGFYLQNTKEDLKDWQSDMGPVAFSALNWKKLRIQPTSPIEGAWLGGVEISSSELGFEPGPMSLGRGLIPSFIDSLCFRYSEDQVHGLSDYLVEKALPRMKEALGTLAKNFSDEDWTDAGEVSNALCEQGVKEILREFMYAESGKLSLTGGLCPWFSKFIKASDFKSTLPKIDFHPSLLTQMALEGQPN